MSKIKENSTNQANKKALYIKCPVTITLNMIGGRWKPVILYQLVSGTKRYGELKKCLSHISEKMLIQQLKALEADGLVDRKAFPVVPPHVEYSLTRSGKSLSPILEAMAKFGAKQLSAKKNT